MRESARAEEACDEEIRRLKQRAITGGDVTAALTLFHVAAEATRALHALWTDPTPRRIAQRNDKSDPPSIEVRREMLAYFLGEADPYPVLQPKKAREKDATQATLKELRSWPFKPRERKCTDVRVLLEQMILPRFHRIQIEAAQPSAGVDRAIWRLPQLSQKTIAVWADVVVRFVVEKKKDELLKKGSRFYRLANPERELANEKRHRTRDLEQYVKKARAKWLADPDPDREPVRQTRVGFNVDRRRKRIASMTVTVAHVKSGLRAKILRYWGSNLAI
jgi:hypothetical protein